MTAPQAISRQTEADDAYATMRRIIRSGELGPGERLVETDLAQRLGLGRNAIRTSLTRLVQDGLVERTAYRGARVRVIGEEEAVEILEARGGDAVWHGYGSGRIALSFSGLSKP